MAVKFNPFTGQLQIDEKGSGGGSSYIDGEVATYNDLPLDGTAALNSAWLVREASGTWLLGRKPAGIYIRTATAGVSRDADYTYAGILPDVFSDANFTLYDDADSTKNAKFQLSGIATGTTRTITVPNKNVTLDDAGDSRTPTAHAASHAVGGSDPLAPSDIGAAASNHTHILATDIATALAEDPDLCRDSLSLGDMATEPSSNFSTVSHVHGNLTSDGKIGSTAGLPVVTTTAGAVTTLALGTANQVLRVNSGATGVEFADPAAGGVTSVSGTAPIVSSGGTTPVISVTTGTTAGTVAAGDDSRITGAAQKSANLSDLASASTARTNLGLGTAATSATGDFAAASHTHELTALAATGATNGHVLTANGSNGVTFAALPASGVTGAAASASDVLGVSGSNITGVDAGSADRLVFWDDSANKLTYLEAGSGLSISGTTLTATGGGGSGGTKTYAVFTAEHNQPPAAAGTFATLDTRNSIAVLDFDPASDESAVFVGIMPEGASLGSGLIVRLHWMATTATSGNVSWRVQFERSNTDLDSDSFAAAFDSEGNAANGTSGILSTTAITVTDIDGITAGDVFRLRVTRRAGNVGDTMSGDAELVAVEIRSAV